MFLCWIIHLGFLPSLALFILMWSNYSCLLDCCLSFPMIWATSYNLETLWCNLMSAEFERLKNPTPQGCHNSHATFKSPFPDISYKLTQASPIYDHLSSLLRTPCFLAPTYACFRSLRAKITSRASTVVAVRETNASLLPGFCNLLRTVQWLYCQ